MAAIQLNFSLRTSANCKTVHLLGSWDNYAGQLPLSKDSAKAGSWKGAFRFQNTMIQQGQRYWYYYILDGYHVSHDPAREHTVEPTTGRKLNILDVPASATTVKSSRHSRHESIAKGRPVSPARIACPRPYKPGQTKNIINESANLEQLSAQFNQVQLSDEDDSDSDSDADSDVPSLTSSRSSASSSSRSSSVSSSSSCCTCERFGITRSGNRVRLDCGGSRCGYSDGDDSSDCGSESENETYRVQQTRRQGAPFYLDTGTANTARKRPNLHVVTNFKLAPDRPPCRADVFNAPSGPTLRQLLKKRYAELAPTQLPPHLHSPTKESPDVAAPPLAPALVQYPTIRGGEKTEMRPPKPLRPALVIPRHVPYEEGWKHNFSRPIKT